MAYFPFMMNIENWKILIVGGGHAAGLKAEAFQGFGADITVIAPRMTSRIEEMKGISRIRRQFLPGDLEGVRVLVAATNDREKNRELCEIARKAGILANAVDDREYCDFIFPAMVRRDNYTVAVSTDGRSPLLAREIKKTISRSLPDSFDQAAGELGKVREKVKETVPVREERQKIFENLAAKYIGRGKLRIGTRGSQLAMIQTDMVMQELSRIGVESEAVVIQTRGDRVQDKPLWKFGGKAVFVSDFEEAIRRGTIDLAVHSAKDMPAECPEGTAVLACLKRGDVRDVLVTRRGGPGLEDGTALKVGTGSLRRSSQLRALYPAFTFESIRGNVPTRIRKLREGRYDGIVLAAAGLVRLELDQEPDLSYSYLDPASFIPAAGQAVITVEGPAQGDIARMVKEINDPAAFAEFSAEREFMKAIKAGCHEAVGAYARLSPEGILTMDVIKDYGSVISRRRASRPAGQARQLADDLAGLVLADDPEGK